MGNFGFKYNDIIYGVLNPRFQPGYRGVRDYWYRYEVYEALLRGERRNPIPYVDYFLEYPPFVGLIYYVSTYIGLESIGDCSLTTCYNEFVKVNYYVHSFILILFHVLTSIIIAYMLKSLNLNPVLTLLYVYSPSTFIYLIYNWDIVCVFFVSLGLYLFIKRKHVLSALSFSASILTKIIPVLFVALILLVNAISYFKKRIPREQFLEITVKFVLVTVLTVLLPYLTLLIVNPRSVIDFIQHLRYWYCENCIYQLFERNIFSETNRVLSVFSITLGLLIIGSINFGKAFNDPLLIIKKCFQIHAWYVVFGYVSSPQMFLLISPLSTLVLKRSEKKLFIKADVLNAMGILFFFKDHELRVCLRNLGFDVKVEFNPWTLPSLAQIVWVTRSLILLIILLTTFLIDSGFIEKLRRYK